MRTTGEAGGRLWRGCFVGSLLFTIAVGCTEGDPWKTQVSKERLNSLPLQGEQPLADWVGVIGTGQSLSVGAAAGTPISTVQPFNNLKLQDNGPDPRYPLDGG